MTPEATRLSEEAIAILREVASHPDSTLLRVPQSRSFAAFREEAFGSCRASSDLTAAERELVAVHRLEVAWLLREACRVMLVEGEAGRRYVNVHTLDGPPFAPLRPGEIAERARRETDLEAPEVRTPVGWLRAFGSWPVFAAATPRQVAAAAHRLEPTNASRLACAIDLVIGDQPRAALPLLRQILGLAPDPVLAVRTVEYVGLAYARLGLHDRACEELLQISGPEAFSASGALTRLLSALALRDDREVLRTIESIDRHVDPDHESVREFQRQLRSQRRAGIWQPAPAVFETAARTLDPGTGIGRRIIDVLS